MHRLVVGLVLASCLLRSDVTARYSMSMEPGPALPPQAAALMKEQLQQMLTSTTLQVKGNRARSTAVGGTITITDFDGLLITLLDEKQKQYATASQKQFIEQLKNRAAPKQADSTLAAMKIETSSKKTGKIREIRGTQAEETEVVLTMQLPSTPIQVKMQMSVWSAAPAQVEKHPGLAELTRYSQRAWEGTDMSANIKAMMQGMPDAGDAMNRLIQSMKEGGILMEMNAMITMPGMMELVRKLDPNAPAESSSEAEVMMTMTQKLEELSTAELPETLFVTPRGYTAVSLSEIMGKFFLPAASASK